MDHLIFVNKANIPKLIPRAGSTDFGMGGDRSPPIGGGPKGGDKGPMGGD